MSAPKRPSRPFIIWTLQRTGGTNLARRLFEASGLPGTDGKRLTTGTFLDSVVDAWKLHEPFNYGSDARPFGFASEAWVECGDREKLDHATEAVCALGMPIKHCVEMVPAEVTESLVKASLRHGYRHVFLYRRNPLNRLLSMEFARRSGVWGAHLKGSAVPDNVVFSKPLNVEGLAEHERQCSEKLMLTWQLLESGGSRPLPMAYEDIYQSAEVAQVESRLAHLLQFLGMELGAAGSAAFIEGIMGSGDQGTRDRYSAFAGIPELEAALGAMPLFRRHDGGTVPRIDVASTLPAWVLHAALDYVPSLVWPDTPASLGGVVVLGAGAPERCGLGIVGQRAIDAHWNIPSPVMAKRFSVALNASQARFRFDAVDVGKRLVVQLQCGDNAIDLFHIEPGRTDA